MNSYTTEAARQRDSQSPDPGDHARRAPTHPIAQLSYTFCDRQPEALLAAATPDELVAAGICLGLAVAAVDRDYGERCLRSDVPTEVLAVRLPELRAWIAAHPVPAVPG